MAGRRTRETPFMERGALGRAQRAPGRANIASMERDGARVCDNCGRPIPKKAMLATNENGKDQCLACQIRDAQITKGLRH